MEVAVGLGRAMECEQKFEQVLEENVAEMDIGELKHEDVKTLVQKGMLEAVRETKVKFVLSAESVSGKLHIKKNETTWCGRHKFQCVLQECPEVHRCRKCLRSLASSWANGDVQVLDP